MDESGLAPCGNLDGGTDELLRNLDTEFLDRFTSLAVDGLVEHLGLTYLKFETFPPHFFNEHGQMKDTTSEYHKGICIETRFYAEREILLKLLVQAFLDMS